MVGERLKPGDVDNDLFDRAKRIEWLDFEKIKESKVLMVGAGATGNETGKNLVLSGFKKITIVDMDYVVKSNLARCLFFSELDLEKRNMKAEVVATGMKKIAPDIKVEPIISKIQDLGEGFVKQFDMVLGCLDNILARLHVNSHCYLRRVPYVDAAMEGFAGKVQAVIPPKTPCLQCGMNRSHGRIVELRFSCTGNDVSFFTPKIAAEITTTSVVSAIQVREALKIICGREDKVIKNVMFYNGIKNTMDVYEMTIDSDCPNH